LAKKEVIGGSEIGFFLLSMRAPAHLQLSLEFSSPIQSDVAHYGSYAARAYTHASTILAS